MRKQIVIAIMMLSLVAALTLTNAVGTASAHTFSLITVDVPFDFSDGATVFPAGKYAIEPWGVNSTAGIRITSYDSKARGTRLSFAAGGTSPKNETALVFHRYGDRYFLSQVWIAGESIGLELPTSSAERAVEREIEMSRGQAADSAPAIVTIAAVQR
jgi:hypothetical protein